MRALPDLTEAVPFQQDRARIDSLAFTADLNQRNDEPASNAWLLAAGDASGMVWIYQVASRRLQTICRGSEHDVFAVAFSPDGMTLASSGRWQARLWDIATGSLRLKIPRQDVAKALAFSADGRKLAIGTGVSFGGFRNVTVLGLEGGRGLLTLRGLSSPSGRLAFSRDSQRLAALSGNWEIGLWTLASNRLERVLLAPKGILADNAALAFSRDDRLLAFATSENVKLWDANSGLTLRSWVVPPGLAQEIGFDPDGRLIHFQWDGLGGKQGGAGCVRELLPDGGQRVLWRSASFNRRVLCACLGSDARLVAFCEQSFNTNRFNHVLRVVEPLTGRELLAPPAYGYGDSDRLVLDPTGQLLGVFGPRPFETLWHQAPGFKLVKSEPFSVLALSPGGRWIAVQTPATGTGFVLRRADAPARSLTLGIYERPGLSFSPDGNFLAAGTSEGTVLVWNLDKTIQCLNDHELGWR